MDLGRSVGFSLGAPISLLGVEVSEVLKGPAPKSPFYVDYPVARFRIGPLTFCNLNKGFEPQPGDEILLFAYSGAVGRDEVLYAPRLDQMLFQGQDGTLFLPSPLKETPEVKAARTLDNVVGLVQSFLTVLESRGTANELAEEASHGRLSGSSHQRVILHTKPSRRGLLYTVAWGQYVAGKLF